MSDQQPPKRLQNGAYVLAATEPRDGHRLVLCWWERKEYPVWWIDRDGHAYAGQYPETLSQAKMVLRRRWGEDLLSVHEVEAQLGESILNLDGLFSDDLRLIAADSDHPPFYCDYAKHKARAMILRTEGRISAALESERVCQYIYESMPDGFRW